MWCWAVMGSRLGQNRAFLCYRSEYADICPEISEMCLKSRKTLDFHRGFKDTDDDPRGICSEKKGSSTNLPIVYKTMGGSQKNSFQISKYN